MKENTKENMKEKKKSLFELGDEFTKDLIVYTIEKDLKTTREDEEDEEEEEVNENLNKETLESETLEEKKELTREALIEKENQEIEEEVEKESLNATCRTCNETFESVEEQREHFKLDWHRFNVKRKLQNKKPLTESEFDDMIEKNEDLSSISGSESEGESEERNNLLKQERSPLIEFQTKEGEFATIWKILLTYKNARDVTTDEVLQNVKTLIRSKKWAIFMCSGGHFAGVCFERDKVVNHKTIHRYTVRRKQGGSQSSKDNAGKKIKSAGASIRRYNEMALQQDIRILLAEWSKFLSEADFIFIQAPSSNRHIFYSYDETPFKKGDTRIRKIPFITRRPTFGEVERIYSLLTTVKFSTISIQEAEKEAREAKEAKEIKEKEVQKKKKKKNKDKEKEKEDDSSTHSNDSVLKRREDVLLFVACSKGRKDLLLDLFTQYPALDLSITNEKNMTCLQVACLEGHEEIIDLLLHKGADPTISSSNNKTAYDYCQTRELRNVFRRYMAEEPSKWNYTLAHVPSPLTPEMEKKENEKREKEKAKEKEKKKRVQERKEKEKAQDEKDLDEAYQQAIKEKAEKEKQKQKATLLKPEVSGIKQGSIDLEREKRARAAEKRMAALSSSANPNLNANLLCSFCQKSLKGLVAFEKLEYKYCSTKCVGDHRNVLEKK